jgi:hypothetical protein
LTDLWRFGYCPADLQIGCFDLGVFGSDFGHVVTQNIPVLANQSLSGTNGNTSYAFHLSDPHSHPSPVIGYVLKDAVRMQVKGGTQGIYRAGDSSAFYPESPTSSASGEAVMLDTETLPASQAAEKCRS